MNLFLSSFNFLNKNIFILICSIHYAVAPADNIHFRHAGVIDNPDLNPLTNINLEERFQFFAPVNANAEYRITVCADIPDNSNSERVNVGQQPGHVFLILEKKNTMKYGHRIVQVFGFYPVRQHSSLLAGDVPAKIMDNSNREYNACIWTTVSSRQFQLLLEKSTRLAERKYNLHKFNCYDYVMDLFNSIDGMKKLPVTHVKLPYFLGRAGSPCGLYKDLKKLKDVDPALAPLIQFGIFTAPESTKS